MNGNKTVSAPQGGTLHDAADDQLAADILLTRQEIEAEGDVDHDDDDDCCAGCNGSGEGMYDGSNCSSCGGSGLDRPHAQDDDPPDNREDQHQYADDPL